ncbi:MAG: DUF11 domain-containing protein, partial [Acidobacteria bacterium]
MKNPRAWSFRRVLSRASLAVGGFLLATAPVLAATGDEISSFPALDSKPSGMAWDGTNLWHADSTADLVYELTTAGAIVSSFATPGSIPQGLTWDGTNLWLSDSGSDLIYQLTTTGMVVSSFSTPWSSPQGLTWDGTYLWLVDEASDLVYQLTTTGMVVSSFATPSSSPTGLTWDGTYLWLVDVGADTVYQLTTTGTVVSSFATPVTCTGPKGITFDGTDFWLACDEAGPSGDIYQLEGPGPPVLTVSKIDSPDPVAAGSNITYTISYSNTGGTAATGVVITDTVPVNTTFVSATDGGTESVGVVTWNIGALAAGGSGSVQMVVQVASPLADGTLITNSTYDIDSDLTAPISGVSITTTVRDPADLALAKSDGVVSVSVGSPLTYTLSVSNAGPNASGAGITVSDTLPANVTVNGGAAGAVALGGADAGDWTCSSNAASPQTISCTTTVSIAAAGSSVFNFATDAIPAVLAGVTL